MNEKKYLRLNDIEAYRISFSLSNFIWREVYHWKNLERDTIGKQFIRATDSVSANIAEGFAVILKKIKLSFIGTLWVLFMNAWIGMKKLRFEIL